MAKKDFWLYNLFRHQAAGVIATTADFGVTILLTETFLLWYGYSNAIGALTGAIINFFISSFWAFKGSKNKLKNQMYKYAIVSAGSLILNSILVILLTDSILQFDYRISKIITAFFIAWTYNFLLMRNYVFKK
ncbi:MAG: GtrA family protein [Flavobacteriales bacterium]|nr:GtrA family protein [Flavobacteriales bacterium]NQX96778.1 GtrA family protein [Flavobacteriales bacterium]